MHLEVLSFGLTVCSRCWFRHEQQPRSDRSHLTEDNPTLCHDTELFGIFLVIPNVAGTYTYAQQSEL